MNILHLIGNGFDLNLGMKTRYSDFYKFYHSINSSSESINKLKKDISANYKNWSDMELALGKYTEHINSVEEFDEMFEDIVEKLAIYLEQQENDFNFEVFDKNQLYESLIFPERFLLEADKNSVGSFKSFWKNHDWNVYIMSFNYTKSIEKILKDFANDTQFGTKSRNVVLRRFEHIHGYVNDRMVIGVNDISQMANSSFHNNTDVLEAFVKNSCNKAYKHMIDESCKQFVNEANLISIFGSSLGDTDNMWWELIGRRLLQDKCNLIIFQKCENFHPRKAYKMARKEREIKELFLSKTKLTEKEKENVASKIFVGLNTNIFKLKD